MISRLMLRFLNPIPRAHADEFTTLMLTSNIKRLCRLNNILLFPISFFFIIEIFNRSSLLVIYGAALIFNLLCMPFFLQRRKLSWPVQKVLLFIYGIFYYLITCSLTMSRLGRGFGINVYLILIIGLSLVFTTTVGKNCFLYLFLTLSFSVIQIFFQADIYKNLQNSNMIFITSLFAFFIARYFYKAKLKTFLYKKRMKQHNKELTKYASKTKKANRALQVSEDRFNTILKSVNDGIWEHYLTENNRPGSVPYTMAAIPSYSREFCIKEIYYSPGVFSMLGYTMPSEDKAPSFLHSLMHREDKTRQAALFLQITRDQIDTYDEIFRYRHVSGTYRFIRVRLICLARNSENKPRRIVGIHTDVSRLKEYELELTKLNSEKNTLFSIIAHDLRSPLSGLSQLLSFILNHKGLISREELFGLLDDARMSLENTRSLVENLLDWSRSQANNIFFNPEEINIYSALQNISSLYALAAGEKEIEIINAVDDTFYVNADRKMFHTIFRNLISNCIKFTSKEGRITLRAKPVNDRITLTIRDTGIGMTEQELSDLFSLSTKPVSRGTEGERGSGLGLILCKEFTERHGGTIEVESKKNEGTAFYVTLPVVQ